MISRVAGNCFWMHRYLERVENTARMLQVNFAFVLDVALPAVERWRPFVIVSGEEPRFSELVGEEALADGEAVQHYLTWDERCPASIITSLHWARENARTIRETISLEMWECMNEFWLWMKEGRARVDYERDRYSFYARAKERCQLFHGICHNTILNAEPFDFMRLGMLLERASQTARILDVKYHAFGTEAAREETAGEVAQWLALLRSCAASEAFLKLNRGVLSGPAVAAFLLLQDRFPRSVLHCLARSQRFITRIGDPLSLDRPHSAADKLAALIKHVAPLTIEKIIEAGLHAELTNIIDAVTEICSALHTDYFDPPIAVLQSQSQSHGTAQGQSQSQSPGQSQSQLERRGGAAA